MQAIENLVVSCVVSPYREMEVSYYQITFDHVSDPSVFVKSEAITSDELLITMVLVYDVAVQKP